MEDFLESLQTNMEDTWGDAQMAEVCQYLYGNTDANLPPEVKQYLPRWLWAQCEGTVAMIWQQFCKFEQFWAWKMVKNPARIEKNKKKQKTWSEKKVKKWRIFMKKWRIFPYAVIFWFLNHFFKNHMHRSPPSNCRHFATVQKGSHIDPFNIWPMSDAPGDIRELKSRQWSCSTLQGGMSYLEEQRRLVKEEHLDIEDQLKVTCQLCSCVVHFLIRSWILSFPH